MFLMISLFPIFLQQCKKIFYNLPLTYFPPPVPLLVSFSGGIESEQWHEIASFSLHSVSSAESQVQGLKPVLNKF